MIEYGGKSCFIELLFTESFTGLGATLKGSATEFASAFWPVKISPEAVEAKVPAPVRSISDEMVSPETFTTFRYTSPDFATLAAKYSGATSGRGVSLTVVISLSSK